MPKDAKRPRSPSIPFAPSKRPFSSTPAAVAEAADESSHAPLGNGDALVSDSIHSPPTNMNVEQSPSQLPSDSKDEASIPRRPASVNEPKIEISMRAIITTQQASIIIGKGGAHINEIREMSGADVKISPSSPNTLERILTVSGALDAVSKAFGLIVRRVHDEPLDQPSVPGSKSFTLELLVPNAWMGSVIGKGGSKIKEMQEASGASIRAKDSMLPNSNERILLVIGVADAIHIAIYYIGNILADQVRRGDIVQQYNPASNGVPYMYPFGGQHHPMGRGYQPDATDGRAGNMTIQMYISSETVGSVIGKNGKRIKDIRSTTQCIIKISSDPDPSDSSKRLVTITGLPQKVNNAKQMLYSAEENAKMNNLQRVGSDGTAASGYQMGEG